MIEKRYELKQVEVVVLCDCGGELEATDSTLLSNPPMRDYICKECQEVHRLWQYEWPRTGYVREEEITSE